MKRLLYAYFILGILFNVGIWSAVYFKHDTKPPVEGTRYLYDPIGDPYYSLEDFNTRCNPQPYQPDLNKILVWYCLKDLPKQ